VDNSIKPILTPGVTVSAWIDTLTSCDTTIGVLRTGLARTTATRIYARHRFSVDKAHEKYDQLNDMLVI
jgi:hypothetical protein